ncbi:MAG: hypothetical protein KKD63_02100 [Proteobacteria bacterium]|nr:hypothetical protein [Desulfobulbaceae bacterium]MBU4151653.1 hypothetical protein [Pseudomonadota bacterium]MDP2105316.1 hypothetical protein [Desulfobulbaceae bacterium]
MNLTINCLKLQLPPGFENRAEAIARCLGDELLLQPWSGSHALYHLQVAPQTVRPEQSDREIAAQIAQAIHQTTGEKR